MRNCNSIILLVENTCLAVKTKVKFPTGVHMALSMAMTAIPYPFLSAIYRSSYKLDYIVWITVTQKIKPVAILSLTIARNPATRNIL